jgi:hypothetical protein
MVVEDRVVGGGAVEKDRHALQLLVRLEPIAEGVAGGALSAFGPHQHHVRALSADLLKWIPITLGDGDLEAVGPKGGGHHERELAVFVDNEGVLLGHRS